MTGDWVLMVIIALGALASVGTFIVAAVYKRRLVDSGGSLGSGRSHLGQVVIGLGLHHTHHHRP